MRSSFKAGILFSAMVGLAFVHQSSVAQAKKLNASPEVVPLVEFDVEHKRESANIRLAQRTTGPIERPSGGGGGGSGSGSGGGGGGLAPSPKEIIKPPQN